MQRLLVGVRRRAFTTRLRVCHGCAFARGASAGSLRFPRGLCKALRLPENVAFHGKCTNCICPGVTAINMRQPRKTNETQVSVREPVSDHLQGLWVDDLQNMREIMQ